MKITSLLVAITIFLLACNSRADSNTGVPESNNVPHNSQSGDQNKTEEVADSAASVVLIDAENKKFQNGERSPAIPMMRQIVRTAQMEMECKEFKAFSATVLAQIKAMGAWVETEQESQTDYLHQNVLTIKVPVENFDGLIQNLAGLDGTLRQKQTDSKDVTNAIVDTKGRIEAKKLIRARYLELLKQANTMEEILQVQAEINSITEDMESAAYNLQHMQAEAATSTIYFTYSQTMDGASGNETPGFAGSLWEAIKDGASGIQNILIVLATLWPLWLLVAAVAIWWKRKRLAAKAAMAKASTS